MKVEITLTFDPMTVLGAARVGRSLDVSRESLADVAKMFPPEVQFCGEFFKNGETREIEVFETYEVIEADRGGRAPGPGMATRVAGEWDAEQNRNLLFKFGGCTFTAHIWSGCPCDCNKMAANIFTPHELGVDGASEGSVTTHQRVTIAWKRIEEEEP